MAQIQLHSLKIKLSPPLCCLYFYKGKKIQFTPLNYHKKEKVQFTPPLNYYKNSIFNPQLQNQITTEAIQLSKPNTFDPLDGFKGGFSFCKNKNIPV
jgi:hypothetical protein